MTATALSTDIGSFDPGFVPPAHLVERLGWRAVALHEQHEGTPLLVIDSDRIGIAAAALTEALPGVELHYAAKANPHPEVLAAVRAAGLEVEVASLAEAVAAIEAGFPAHTLWCTRLHLLPAERRRIRELGVRRFVVDNDHAAEAAGPDADLLVRVDVGRVGAADWPLAGKDGLPANDAAQLARRHPNVLGPAFHVGSQQTDPMAWAMAASAVSEVFADAGAPLHVLDAGGGFPADGVVGPAGPFTWSPAGEALLAVAPAGARLLAEPGRAVIADAGALVTTVVDVSIRRGQPWAHLDVGVYTGLPEAAGEAVAWTAWSPDHDGERQAWCVAGPSCDSTDVLARGKPWWLPADLQPGDRVVLFGTGAYTTGYLPAGRYGFNGLPIPQVVVV